MSKKNASSSDVQDELKGHCCHIRQDQDIFKCQAVNQVSLCRRRYAAQSNTALLVWQPELSLGPKSILTPAAQVLLSLIQLRAAKTVSERRSWESNKYSYMSFNRFVAGQETSLPAQGKAFPIHNEGKEPSTPHICFKRLKQTAATTGTQPPNHTQHLQLR